MTALILALRFVAELGGILVFYAGLNGHLSVLAFVAMLGVVTTLIWITTLTRGGGGMLAVVSSAATALCLGAAVYIVTGAVGKLPLFLAAFVAVVVACLMIGYAGEAQA